MTLTHHASSTAQVGAGTGTDVTGVGSGIHRQNKNTARRPQRRLARPKRAALPMAALLVLQCVAMFTLRNTAFQDEALYLYAGTDLWQSWQTGRPPLENYASYFSGTPAFYPVLAGWLNSLGGLELARTFSSVCVLWITYAAYNVGRHLFGRRAGLAGATVLAVQGSLLFIGRLATYDALCLALLALAAVISVRTGRAWWRIPLVALVCIAAALAKYAGAAFVPMVVVLLLTRLRWRRQRRLSIAVGTLAAVSLAATVVWALTSVDPGLVQGLMRTTAYRVVAAPASRVHLLRQLGTVAGPAILMGVFGSILAIWRRHHATRVVAIAALGTTLLAPAYHIVQAEPVSMDKHVAFGLFFAAPMIGYACNTMLTLVGRLEWKSRVAGVAVILLFFGSGLQQAQSMYARWPNSSTMVHTLRQIVGSGNTRILAEEFEVPRYYLAGLPSAQDWQFTGLNHFDYTTADRTTLHATAAYRQALKDGYFGVVVFRYGPSRDLALDLTHEMMSTGQYQEVTVPAKTGQDDSPYRIFRRTHQ